MLYKEMFNRKSNLFKKMDTTRTVALSLLVVGVWTKDCRNFPESFSFGAGTSAYQIEGGWNASDKGPSIWDVHTHENPGLIADGSNGDVACDSYNLWMDDIEIASELGLDNYRFSISWPRILPNGTSEKISETGVRYYDNLIDRLLEKGIEPIVTMHHFDVPQRLQSLGGWTNPLISDWFAEYAKILYTLYGKKVKKWMTINEPLILCTVGYGFGDIAPGVKDYDIGYLQCAKNIMIAHAKAYRIYEKEFVDKFQGKVGIVNHILNIVPETEEDEELAELATQLYSGIYSHPIYSKEGGWPSQIEKFITENSKKQGFSSSKLPPFTDEEKELVKGTANFYGMNYYTGRQIRKVYKGENVTINVYQAIPELGAVLEFSPNAINSSWVMLDPVGLRRQLLLIKENYGDIEIIISENGYPSTGYNLEDNGRIDYIEKHLEQIILAINEDNINVTGYIVWALMDNFEWSSGYSSKFGLYEVDYNDPMRRRTPRASAHYYANVIKTKSLEV